MERDPPRCCQRILLVHRLLMHIDEGGWEGGLRGSAERACQAAGAVLAPSAARRSVTPADGMPR